MKDFKKISGARESSAGDDFYLLWAVRKALSLLEPNTSLKALGIEGPDKEEAESLDPDGDKLLAVDLAEYFVGECFNTADNVVLSQLKYSTRNPRKEWTAARLCEGKDSTGRGSVIRRLAETFERYYSRYGREAVLRKLKLKLVSNRPVSKRLECALRMAQGLLNQHPSRFRAKTVLDHLAGEERVEIERLFQASRLGSYEFTDFLRVLDFSDCGEQSRFGQKIELVKELGRYGTREISAQYRALKDLIWDRMMPEAWKERPLTKEDILPVFCSTFDSIYPAESKFELPQHVLERKEASELACTVVGSAGKPICLHSAGGKGKTVLVQKLEKELPPHSVVIVFDCYGGGTYLNPADTRHTHKRAILQIANELAARTGGPLLLEFNLSPEDFLRELLKRVDTAVSLMQKLNPDALVVIVVDAADNSVYAAREKNEKSFVHDLLKQPLPGGSRLVVTCRTENREMLNLPEHKSFELGGFELSESAAHLRLYFPEATDEQTEEFHRLTNGIPRVQGYALSFRQKGLNTVLASLRPGGKTLEGIFESWFDEAKKRPGTPEDVDRICEALIALPRPVPLVYAAALADVPPGTLESFCADIGFGVVVEKDTVSFRDQDFEDYLRQRLSNVEEITGRIADLLYQNRHKDRYAAYHLDTFLARTGRFQELRDLVIEEEIGSIVTDPVEQQEIKLKRIRSALKVGANQKERADIIKLLLIAAETVKTDAAVRKLIMENADLAESFGDPQTVQRLHVDVGRQKWPVPGLFQCAKVLSRFESMKKRASENLKEAHGWLRWLAGVPEDQRHLYPIESRDIAAGAEAILQLHGAKAARDWLWSWKPPRDIYDCAYLHALSVLRVDGKGKLEHYLSKLTVRADIILAMLRVYREVNITPPIELVARAVKVWCRFGRSGRRPAQEILPDGVTLCEAAAQDKSLHPFVAELLPLFLPSLMDYAPHLYGDQGKSVDVLVHSRILQARLMGKEVAVDLFLPEELKQKREDLPYSEREKLERRRREFKQVFGSLLPAYELRADALLGTVSKESFEKRFKDCLVQIERDYEVRWRHDAMIIYRMIALALADAALMISEEPARWFRETENVILGRRVGGAILLKLSLAEKAVSRRDLHGEALHLLHEVRQELERAPGTASEQIDFLIRCAHIAGTVDPAVARYYFQLAVKAASEVDEEAYAQISCLASLAEKAASDPQFSAPELAYHFARFAEDCHRRMYGWDHFPWDDILKGLSCLDTASAFAVLSRWDDRGVIHIEDEILAVLLRGVQRGFISAETAWAMSVLAAPFDRRYENYTTAILDQGLASGEPERTIRLLTMIAEDIQLYAPIEERKARASAVLDWAVKHGLDHSQGAVSLMELVRFLDRNEAKAEVQGIKWRDEGLRKTPDWVSVFDGRTFLTPDEIESAIDEVKGYDTYGNLAVKELLKQIQVRCGPRDYVTQLDALIRVDPKKLPIGILLDALDSRFAGWNYHPNVWEWRKANPSVFLERRFAEMFIYDRFRSDVFKRFRDVFGVNDKDILDLVIRVLPHWIDVPAQATYGVVQELLPSLTPAEAEAVLQWVLKRLSARIPDDWADGSWREELCPPKEAMETLARFLWRLFGHPDKRLRWRAAHAVRRMVRLGRSEVVDVLVSHVSDKNCPAFRDQQNCFFWLSARLWVFILLDRLAKEAPEVVKPHYERIAQEALKPEVPHALIRHFAQSAALALHKCYPELSIHNERAQLEAVNKSPYAQVECAKTQYPEGLQEGSANLRFRFDATDTLPYWYEPLGRVFGMGATAVAQIAEKWICDRWGFSNEDLSYDNDWIKKRYNYNLWSNNHGSEPVVETRQSYAVWHAMFCVADHLLRNRPVVRDEGKSDPYGNWLARWTIAWPNFWLADIRDPVPLEDIYWSLERPESKDWEQEISPDAFDPLVRIPDSLLPGFIVLHGWCRRANQGASETMHISSALVTPETAPALLRALQTVVNPRDYRIPPEGDELEIAEEGFELKGWLKILQSDWEGIDQNDPLRNNLSSSLVVPGKDFVEWGNLVSSPERKHYWRKGNEEEKVTILECWNDLQVTEREYKGFYSEGHRFWVRVKTLLEYLRNRRRCLIVECMIDRWVDRKGLGKYVPGKAKIYLIHPDGTVETLRERYCLG